MSRGGEKEDREGNILLMGSLCAAFLPSSPALLWGATICTCLHFPPTSSELEHPSFALLWFLLYTLLLSCHLCILTRQSHIQGWANSLASSQRLIWSGYEMQSCWRGTRVIIRALVGEAGITASPVARSDYQGKPGLTFVQDPRGNFKNSLCSFGH